MNASRPLRVQAISTKKGETVSNIDPLMDVTGRATASQLAALGQGGRVIFIAFGTSPPPAGPLPDNCADVLPRVGAKPRRKLVKIM